MTIAALALIEIVVVSLQFSEKILASMVAASYFAQVCKIRNRIYRAAGHQQEAK